mgnify:CR=1 FL=1
MSDKTVEKASKLLSDHRYLNLGTVSPSGQPMVHTMAYGSEGTTVYFFTSKDTRKVKNILANPKVGYTVDHDRGESMGKMVFLQVQGIAKIVEMKPEVEKAQKLILTKIPEMAKMPPNPKMILLKVDPKEFILTDNSLGFGHQDKVEL